MILPNRPFVAPPTPRRVKNIEWYASGASSGPWGVALGFLSHVFRGISVVAPADGVNFPDCRPKTRLQFVCSTRGLAPENKQ